VARTLRLWWAGWHSARQQAHTRRALGALSDATLRDIGLMRAEIGSAAAELHGSAARSRALAPRVASQ